MILSLKIVVFDTKMYCFISSHLMPPSNKILLQVLFNAYRPDDREREGTGRAKVTQSCGRHTIQARRMQAHPLYLQTIIVTIVLNV